MDKKLVYVADDEQTIRDLLKQYLEKEDYSVETYPDGKQLLDAFNKKACDMLVIDIMMPHMDGYTLCKEIRKKSDVPIIIVSAKDDEIDRILGLELGGDDYLSKPFSPRELIIRMKKIFKRMAPSATLPQSLDKLICKDIILLKDRRTVLKDEVQISVTTKEFELLCLFIENINIAFSRDKITEHIWGYDYIGDTRQVDDLIKRLRKKMILAGTICQIETVWGYGYKISG